MQYILIGNCGNHSLAALQYLLLQSVSEIHLVYVDTGWASSHWDLRVAQTKAFADTHQVSFHTLKAVADFKQMVNDRKQFPSQKFQWCAGFLKGLTILNFLEDIDPFCQATIVSGKRQLDARRYENLTEYQEEDNCFNGRTIWHPLWNTNHETFKRLVHLGGFDFLAHPARECHPCIHASVKELGQLGQAEKTRLEQLEQELQRSMFVKPVHEYVCNAQSKNIPEHGNNLKEFDSGCGSAWNCGE